MGENTEELVVSLENSLSSDICDTVGDLAEVGLDAVMDDGILKDIPILSTVVGLYRIGYTIRERHEIKQLALFVAELNRGCTDESKRKQLLEKLNNRKLNIFWLCWTVILNMKSRRCLQNCIWHIWNNGLTGRNFQCMQRY